jgi:type IV pilus assembly protein PilA
MQRKAFVPLIVLACSPLLNFQTAEAARPSLSGLEAGQAEQDERLDALEAGSGPLDPAAAQVRTALDILPVFQEAVARSFRETGEAPANRGAAGLSIIATDTQTNYISSVNVLNGTIIFTFGNNADLSLVAKMMTFTPYESPDLTIAWRCGTDPAPPGTALLGTSGGGVQAAFMVPTIPPSTYPDPCIITSQPGSGDDLIRAQVAEGLTLAAVARAAVAESFSDRGEAPATRMMAGMTSAASDTSGNYVTSVGIVNGTITITYGNQAHLAIDGESLSLTPYESPDLSVIWRCGNEPQPAGASLMGTSGAGVTAAFIAPSPGMLPRYVPPCILTAQPPPNDVTRAQVLEPFDVVETLQHAVEIAGAALGSPNQPRPPVDRTEAGLTAIPTDTVGHYFVSVGVWNGVITVTYGSEAKPQLAYETLSWTPYESVDGTIVWRCGLAPMPEGTQLMGTASNGGAASYVAPSAGMLPTYLPSACRW